MRNGLQIEDQLALLALANADSLLWKILKAALGDPDRVLFWVKIGNLQLAALRCTLLKFTVQEDFRLVLTSHDQNRTDVLPGLQESAEGGCRPGINIQLVFVISAAH